MNKINYFAFEGYDISSILFVNDDPAYDLTVNGFKLEVIYVK